VEDLRLVRHSLAGITLAFHTGHGARSCPTVKVKVRSESINNSFFHLYLAFQIRLVGPFIPQNCHHRGKVPGRLFLTLKTLAGLSFFRGSFAPPRHFWGPFLFLAPQAEVEGPGDRGREGLGWSGRASGCSLAKRDRPNLAANSSGFLMSRKYLKFLPFRWIFLVGTPFSFSSRIWDPYSVFLAPFWRRVKPKGKSYHQPDNHDAGDPEAGTRS